MYQSRLPMLCQGVRASRFGLDGALTSLRGAAEMSAGRQYTYDHGRCGFEEESHADM